MAEQQPQPQIVETADLVAALEERLQQAVQEGVHQQAILKRQARALGQAAETMKLLEEQVRTLGAVPINHPQELAEAAAGEEEPKPNGSGNRSQRRRQSRTPSSSQE